MTNTIHSLRCKGKLLTLETPVVMGILNITPDSFYEGSRHGGVEDALMQAQRMLNEGAAILDIGGQSTRPGATLLSWQQELDRVLPVIEAISAQYPEAILSVDTFYPEVALEAVKGGAAMVNDVSGGMLYPEMLATVGRLQVPYVCMHMRGTPATMQQNLAYEDVVTDLIDFFALRVDACRRAGIHDVIIDPGFGFSKTISHNFQLLRRLEAFHILQCPLLVGVSRKSTIYKTLGITAGEALNGTTVLNTLALAKGAHILRVHDVKEAMEAIVLVGETFK